jgi:hypothetical protein
MKRIELNTAKLKSQKEVISNQFNPGPGIGPLDSWWDIIIGHPSK